MSSVMNHGKQRDKGIRLQKVLADYGLASRREAEGWITAGRITVNRRPAVLGDRVLTSDDILLDGRPVRRQRQKPQLTLLYNKPTGEVCTRSDPDGRPTVFGRLPRLTGQRWISVGRLDFNTAGLLLFTTDGELASRLMHPRYAIEREYAVRVHSRVDEAMLQRLRQGVMLDDGQASFNDVQPGYRRRYRGSDEELEDKASNEWYYVVLTEGRNREVRRLWESQGITVSRLKRVRFAHLLIPSRVSAGRWVTLSGANLQELYRRVELDTQKQARPRRPGR